MKIWVTTEESIVRTVIDINNVMRPEHKRIHGIEYAFFEALIYAQRELGTINSLSADNFVKRFVGKPNMSRKSFLIHRNALVEKEWLRKENSMYVLPEQFNLHRKEFKKSGVLATITLERADVLDGQNTERQN